MARAMRRSAQPPAVTRRQAAALIAKYGRGKQGSPHSGCGVEKTGRRTLVDELLASSVSNGRIAEILIAEYPGTYITVRIVQNHARKLCACYRPR